MSIFNEFAAKIRGRWRRMDRLVRAMIVNWVGGMIVGLVCAALLLGFDFFSIRSLLLRSDVAVAGALLLSAGFAFTFGGLVCAGAVMTGFGVDDDSAPRGGRRFGALRAPRFARVAIPARRS